MTRFSHASGAISSSGGTGVSTWAVQAVNEGASRRRKLKRRACNDERWLQTARRAGNQGDSDDAKAGDRDREVAETLPGWRPPTLEDDDRSAVEGRPQM